MKKLLLLIIISISSSAHPVYVKHFGEVSLENFNCYRTSSSFIYELCYDDESKMVIGNLKGNRYAWCGITDTLFNSWLSASSKGRFFHSKIKLKYDC